MDGKLITKDNVIHETLLQSYLDYEVDEDDPSPVQAEHQARRERSSDIARAVIDQLDQQGWDVATLVEDLQTRGPGPPHPGVVLEPRAAAGLGGGRGLGPAAPGLAAPGRPEPGRQQAGPVPRACRPRSSTARCADGSEVTVRIHVENQTPTEG